MDKMPPLLGQTSAGSAKSSSGRRVGDDIIPEEETDDESPQQLLNVLKMGPRIAAALNQLHQTASGDSNEDEETRRERLQREAARVQF
eukprot:6497573-Prymnesium_polylepis.1